MYAKHRRHLTHRNGTATAVLCVAVAATLAMAAPGAAGASDATKFSSAPIQLQYEADPGESNGVNIRKSTNGQKYIIQDGGAVIEPHEGCEREFASQVRCDASGVTRFVAILGDLADTIDASAMDVPSHIGGREGGDFMIGSPLAERLAGNDGADTIYGGAGADDLEGQNGADQLFGQGGNDDLPGGPEDDRLHGGPENDRLRGMDGTDTLFADPGADLLRGQGTSCTATCAPEAPTDDSSERDAVTYASYSSDVFVTIDGLANDGGNSGAEGDNVFTDIEYVQGGSGNDRLEGSSEGNILEGLDGSDSLLDRGGPDFLFGDRGDDRFFNGGGPDAYQGGPGRDAVSYAFQPGTGGVSAWIDGNPNDGNAFDEGPGGTRDNIELDVEDLTGSDGPDDLIGSSRPNTLHGVGGDDTLDGGETACGGQLCLLPRADTLDGDLGIDTARYVRRNVPLTITMDGTPNDGAQDEQDNVIDIEIVTGGSGPDTITGDAQANQLEGRLGNDELNGGDRADDLRGGPGQDIMRGSTGSDSFDAVDGEVDQVLCGPDNDTVTADTIDNVANSCENVTRA